MSTAPISATSGGREAWLPWALVGLGLAAMYLPVYRWAFDTIWTTDEHGHGPIILAIVVWLFWRQAGDVLAAPVKPAWGAGAAAFGFGLLLFVFGRVMGFSILQFLSQMPVALGLLLLTRGWGAVRAAWFPLIYLIFMVPLPGTVVDAVTGQLKQWVSVVAEELLYATGYPIGRSGVTLTIGQYQLLVADACSGLNSMFSLAAIGLLYCYITARKSIAHNAVMIAAVIPIAFAANVFRVIVLVLITYYAGDEAAQGFLHGAAGIILMVFALIAFFLLDALLSKVFRSH